MLHLLVYHNQELIAKNRFSPSISPNQVNITML